MDIKPITNNDFDQLMELSIDMYKAIGKELNKEINSFQAVNTIIHQINNEVNFLAIGLYDENILMGFVTGHEIAEQTFYFSGIYLVEKNKENTKNLIEYCFDYIKNNGYTAWEVDATNDNIASIMVKYNATPKYTRYRKELDKEQADG